MLAIAAAAAAALMMIQDDDENMSAMEQTAQVPAHCDDQCGHF